LVMMLRSQHIPARMVVGFRGGEYNALGDYYQVLQRHAHAWVEAYLTPEEAKAESPPEAAPSPLGGWLRLDPTPGSDIDRARLLQQGWIDVVDDVLDLAKTMWTDYILGLTAKRQQEAIYEPVANRASPESWATMRQRLNDVRRRTVRWVGSVSPILGAVLVAVITLGVAWYVQRGRRNSGGSSGTTVWQRRRANGELVHEPSTSVQTSEFYRRLETALNRLGLSRGIGQTPRELASQAGERLAALLPRDAVAELPSQIVEILYRVRFSSAGRDQNDRRVLDGLLSRLEQAVPRMAERPKRPSRS